MPGIDTDEFMPEFWPANKILGLILDDQLEGIDAGKIVGQIVNAQVASLAAAKIEGKLTSAQIETIAAEQITGKLTNEQIAEIAAAKIVGKLTDAQLGGISAAKIIGEIASGQIASLEALKITGQLTSAQIKELEAAKIKGELTNAQIKTIEAAKVTGQLSNAQIAGLASAKIEGLLTSTQIENLAVAKLVGQISESQIAAKAVTAGKINVAELSAISVNAGLIEAGTFKGVTFETASGKVKLNNEGLKLTGEKTTEPEAQNRVEWFTTTKEKIAEVLAFLSLKASHVVLKAVGVKEFPTGMVELQAVSLGAEGASTVEKIVVYSEEKASGIEAGTILITNSKGESSFLQLSSNRKERDFGLVTELPKTPSKGDRCQFIADKTNGVIWLLIYDGEGEFPWKKIGGPPLLNEVETLVETASAKFVGLTGGPEIKTPLKGDYYVGLGCKSYNSVAASNHLMSYKIGETEAQGVDSVDPAAPTNLTVPISAYRRKRKNKLAAATTLLCQYLTSGGSAKFEQRFIEIDPIRVG